MTSSSIWLVLLLALVGANLPFVSRRRLLGVIALPQDKRFGVRVLEWLLMYGVVGALAHGLESRLGQAAPQGWQFYAVTLAMFAVLAFPGYVLRHLWRMQPR